jgi:hypothetical protein
MPGSRTNHDSLTTSAEGANENSPARGAASAGKTEGREKSRQGRLIILQLVNRAASISLSIPARSLALRGAFSGC